MLKTTYAWDNTTTSRNRINWYKSMWRVLANHRDIFRSYIIVICITIQCTTPAWCQLWRMVHIPRHSADKHITNRNNNLQWQKVQHVDRWLRSRLVKSKWWRCWTPEPQPVHWRWVQWRYNHWSCLCRPLCSLHNSSRTLLWNIRFCGPRRLTQQMVQTEEWPSTRQRPCPSVCQHNIKYKWPACSSQHREFPVRRWSVHCHTEKFLCGCGKDSWWRTRRPDSILCCQPHQA